MNSAENILTAPDGTKIVYQRTGSGPALVVVVGAFCDRSSTAELSAVLSAQFTVYEYDRRGRGASTDTWPYAIEREVEDLATLVEETGGPAFVYGHSSGAVLALEAAARGVPIRKLLGYEPPYSAEGDPDGGSDELLSTVQGLVAAGDLDDAAAAFLAATGMPAHLLTAIRQGPGWPRMRAMAPTLVYDLILCNGGVVPRRRLAAITAPSRLLAGGDSAPWAGTAAVAVAESIPGGQSSTVPGQNHAVAQDVIALLLQEYFTS